MLVNRVLGTGEPREASLTPQLVAGPAVSPSVVEAPALTVSEPDVSTGQTLEAFCAEISDRLVGVLTLRLGDRATAEEIAQEALARACVNWSEVGSMQNPGGWVYRTALNLAASRYRRLSAERRALKRVHSAASPPRREEASEAMEFRAIIQRLSRRQQEVIALRFYADQSVDATAAILGVSPGTVKTLTHRALKMLRKHLEDNSPDSMFVAATPLSQLASGAT